MRMLSNCLLVVALIAFTSVATAQEKAKCTEGKCTASAKGECKDGKCPIATAMAKLPKMEFKVGTETTCCEKSAAAMAKKNNAAVSYVVGDKSFEKKEEAFAQLVDSTEKFVSKFTTPCKCDVSKVTSIAGKSCSCPVEAKERTELVTTAVKKVQMTYKVGEKTCSCPNEAAMLAEKSGAKKEFVVGKETTCCEMSARLALARAKYKAAVEALANAAKEKTEKDS